VRAHHEDSGRFACCQLSTSLRSAHRDWFSMTAAASMRVGEVALDLRYGAATPRSATPAASAHGPQEDYQRPRKPRPRQHAAAVAALGVPRPTAPTKAVRPPG
jgi:hypothetical protein